MAFNSIGLVNYVETPTSVGLRLWDYSSTVDNAETIATEGYFNNANSKDEEGNLLNANKGLPLRVGDIIGVIATDKSHIAYVKQTDVNIVVQIIQNDSTSSDSDNSTESTNADAQTVENTEVAQ